MDRGSGPESVPTGADVVTINNGYRARWQGTEYEASPDGELVRLFRAEPAPGFEAIRPDRHRRLVLVADTEWFGYVRTVATRAGEPVVVLAADRDRLLVEYYGDRADLAGWRGWVDSAECSDLAEERWPAR